MNESNLFIKYKSSYSSACFDFSKHVSIISGSFYLLWLNKNNVISWLMVPVISFLLNRTFIIFHDCCHGSYSPSKQLNYILSHITGVIVVTSPNWILDHHTHHLTNGNIENKQNYFFNETIILTKKQYNSLSTTKKWLYFVYKHPLVFFTIIPALYFGVFQRFIYIYKKWKHPKKFTATLQNVIQDHAINNVGVLIYFYILSSTGILYHISASLVISFSISFMIFHNQHSYNPAYVVKNDKWSQRNSGLLGSSFIQIPHFLKYFYMGIEYHHIHHMNSKIPGYNLEGYHNEVISNSDWFDNVHRVGHTEFYNNLWLTLFDEETNKYITFYEKKII